MRAIQVCMHEKHTYTVTHTHTHTPTLIHTCTHTYANTPTCAHVMKAETETRRRPSKFTLPSSNGRSHCCCHLCHCCCCQQCLPHDACCMLARKHFSIFRLTLLQENVTELDVHPIQSHSCSGHCSASRTPADSICCTERRSIMAWTWSRSTSNRMSRCAS